MCGAFTFTQYKRIVKEYGFKVGSEFLRERFNIRPSDFVPAVFPDFPNTIQLAQWGIVPSWAKDKKINLLFNTRSDSLIEKPYFKKLFHNQRCLVLADGFYEWAKVGNEKVPYRFILKNEEPFAFAGIWEATDMDKPPQVSIITTEPNELVAKVHNRMPVILSLDHAQDWIQNTDEKRLYRYLEPLNPIKMDMYKVSQSVNSGRNDSPELIKPIEIKAA